MGCEDECYCGAYMCYPLCREDHMCTPMIVYAGETFCSLECRDAHSTQYLRYIENIIRSREGRASAQIRRENHRIMLERNIQRNRQRREQYWIRRIASSCPMFGSVC